MQEDFTSVREGELVTAKVEAVVSLGALATVHPPEELLHEAHSRLLLCIRVIESFVLHFLAEFEEPLLGIRILDGEGASVNLSVSKIIVPQTFDALL